MTILLPAETEFRLRVGRGASALSVEARSFGALGGPIDWASANHATASDRYDIVIDGGASNLVVGCEW